MNLKINYNPYLLKFEMEIDGKDISDSCYANEYSGFLNFIDANIPMQNWLDPIPYKNWNGFLDELCDPERNDELNIEFEGRRIDFNDLKYSLENQNNKRDEKTRIVFSFNHTKVIDDEKISERIDEVVEDLTSDWFKELVDKRNSQELKEQYENLTKNYEIAKNNEFQIVFSGIYSAGKSSIINSLIRHDILPVSQDTCTNRVCYIKHDNKLSSQIRLNVYKNDKPFLNKLFKNDENCLNTIKEISATNDSDDNEKIRLEVGLNLSHLYPKTINKKMFTITVVDTPGFDSNMTENNGENAHEITALNAISDENKPINIFCAELQRYESGVISQVMGDIIEQSNKDGGVFNDRFMFLLNKAEELKYTEKNIDDVKNDYSKYLTDTSKWKNFIEKDVNVNFVPRVFFTSALVSHAISKGYVDEDAELTDEQYDEYSAYDNFRKRVKRDKGKNLFLSNHCDISDYRKQCIQNAIEETESEPEKLNLQTGMVAVEYAIKDFIERYAYPVKVRSVLESFNAVLNDVNSFYEDYSKRLSQKVDDIKEKEQERNKETDDNCEKTEYSKKMSELHAQIYAQLCELEKIRIDEQAFAKLRTDYIKNIEGNKTISDIRAKKKNISTNDSEFDAESQLESNVKTVVKKIDSIFEGEFPRLEKDIKNLAMIQINKLDNIYKELCDIINQIENSGALNIDGYDFKNSVLWQSRISGILSNHKATFDSLPSKIVKNAKIKSETKSVYNPKRVDWECGNLLQKMFAWTKKKYVYVTTYEIKDIYRPIIKYLDNTRADYMSEIKDMEEYYDMQLEGYKEFTKDTINKITTGIKECEEEIKLKNQRIKELNADINRKKKEEDEIKRLNNKLNNLKLGIEECYM